jgi:hypothetical protein
MVHGPVDEGEGVERVINYRAFADGVECSYSGSVLSIAAHCSAARRSTVARPSASWYAYQGDRITLKVLPSL